MLMYDPTKMVTISEEEYRKLREEHQLLASLRAYGVEEWENWDKAMKVLEEDIKNGYC